MKIRLFKDPLLHFLLLGGALFLVFDALNPIALDDPRVIAVDRARLLTYMQQRAKQFDEPRFNAALDRLPAEQLQTLIDDYRREEALYREAKALNLDANDAVARQRLIQQVTYITRGVIDAGIQLDEQALRDYHQANRARYQEPANITFTHVYFSVDRHGKEKARALALEVLNMLKRQQVPFHQGLSYGDRFLYHANYVNKEADLVASHFSAEMQAALFAATPSNNEWQGPFESAYGMHVAMITNRNEARDPSFEELAGRVQQDALQAQVQAQLQKAITSIVEAYTFKVTPALQQRLRTDAKVGTLNAAAEGAG